MVGSKTLAFCLGAAVLAQTPSLAATKAAWRNVNGDLVYSSPRYALDVDAVSGAPRMLEMGGKPVVTFGPSGWWRATFDDSSTGDASQAKAAVTVRGKDLVCKYVSDKLAVQLRISPDENGVNLRAYVAPKGAVVTRFSLPADVDFARSTLNEVDYPEELGRALKPGFFAKQPDRYSQWKQTMIGERGAADAGILPSQMLDYGSPAGPVKVTGDGRIWLGDVAAGLDGWSVRAPRPPQGTPDVTLLATDTGPLLSLQSLGGGWGWFVRWGGIFADQDQRRVVDATVAAAAHLWSTPPPAGDAIHPSDAARGRPLRDTSPAQIGLIDLNRDNGARRRWTAALARLGCKVVDIDTPEDLLTALSAHSCWMVINLDQETIPASQEQEPRMASTIRDYVANGGVWVHLGGAPFYYSVERQPYNVLDADYPPLFSDFLHVDAKQGQVSVYGIQNPADYFVPGHLTVSGTDQGGRLARAWITWIPAGSTWMSPKARIAVGERVDKAVREYGIANGFTKPLASKVRPDVLAKWKQSLLINYSGPTFAAESAGIAHLPSPSIVHIWDYLHGGFDKQYPDHLPPNPDHGSPAEFSGLFSTVHASGDLMMPYTNPTWWCDGPPGPTFIRDGRAPLTVDRDGKNVREVYGRNSGWALCTWHPDALAAEKSILTSFTTTYPVDILFQDQIGARSPEYDFNPAAPNPDTYTDGMRRIAERDSRVVPVGTENGFDAVMNFETEFCGLCWSLFPTPDPPSWANLWQTRYAPGTWAFRPMALWLAHDKDIFAMHDLGQFDMDRQTLAWTLATGYELSAHVTTGDIDRNSHDPWIGWIAALQRDFGPEIVGAPLVDWREPLPGVYRARYGDAVVTANTNGTAARIDNGTTLAPFGFLIVDEKRGLTAGSVLNIDGAEHAGGLDFVREHGRLTVFHPRK